MFKWFRNWLKRPRLIERYGSLSDIIDAHNKLVTMTSEVANDMSPAYLCSRINMIQDAEERAVRAYWRNKKNKYDVWQNKAEKATTAAPTADAKAAQANEPPSIQLAATPPLTALGGEIKEVQAELSAADTFKAIESPPESEKDKVIEIHINK